MWPCSSYADQLCNGDASGFGCKIVPNDPIVAAVDAGPMLVFEAGASFGQASARAAMEAAVARAKEHGVCMLGDRLPAHPHPHTPTPLPIPPQGVPRTAARDQAGGGGQACATPTT